MKEQILKVLNNYFLPYQKKWITDESRKKINEKSRRIGITYCSSFRRVLVSLYKPHHKSWVISKDATTSKEFIEYCRLWILIINALIPGIPFKWSGLYEDDFYMDPDEDCQIQRIIFPNGSKILALSSNPDAAAGKGGDILLDEFAIHKDQKKLYDIAVPCIVWGGQLEIISTHRGIHSVFNQLIIDAKGLSKKKFSYHKTDLIQAIEAGFVEKLNMVCAAKGVELYTEESFFNEMRAECRTEEAFLQEFMCQPSAIDSALIRWELISDASMDNEEYKKFQKTAISGDIYIGVDVGRVYDLTVIWVLEKLGGTFFTRHIERMENIDYPEQVERLMSNIERFKPKRVAIDNTGIGVKLCYPCELKYGKYKIIGIDFTNAIKEELAMTVLVGFTEHILKIPDDIQTMEDIYSVHKEVSGTGVVRYAAPKTPDGHADAFWALACCLTAAGLDPGPLGGFTVSNTKDKYLDDDFEDEDELVDSIMDGF